MRQYIPGVWEGTYNCSSSWHVWQDTCNQRIILSEWDSPGLSQPLHITEERIKALIEAQACLRLGSQRQSWGNKARILIPNRVLLSTALGCSVEWMERLGCSDGGVAWPKVCRDRGYVHFQLLSHVLLAWNRQEYTLLFSSQLCLPTGSKEEEELTPGHPPSQGQGQDTKPGVSWAPTSHLSARVEDNFHPFHRQGNRRQPQRGPKTDYRMSFKSGLAGHCA